MNYTLPSPSGHRLSETPPAFHRLTSSLEDQIENTVSQVQTPPLPDPASQPSSFREDTSRAKQTSLEDWDVDAVANWLQSVGLNNVVSNFVGKSCDEHTLRFFSKHRLPLSLRLTT